MTSAAQTFLSTLVDRGVTLSITAPGTTREALHYKAPQGILTKVDLDALRQHKPALLLLVELWDERTAIMEHDGKLSCDEAGRLAWTCVVDAPYHSINHIPSDGEV
jgi:hypothetical protein